MKVPVFQLLTASFTLKIEKGNKIAFLDMPFTMEPDRCLNTSVYRKPTHTDQYLPVAYDSHYPQSVKPGIVTCSYDQAKVSHDKTINHLRGKETFVICSFL